MCQESIFQTIIFFFNIFNQIKLKFLLPLHTCSITVFTGYSLFKSVKLFSADTNSEYSLIRSCMLITDTVSDYSLTISEYSLIQI